MNTTVPIECTRNNHKLQQVSIESGGSIKQGIRLDDLNSNAYVHDVIQSYVFRRGTISETLAKEIERNGVSLKAIKPGNRRNATDKPRPLVLVYKIDNVVLKKLAAYTPREATIEIF